MQPKRTMIKFATTRPGLVIFLVLVMTLMFGFLFTQVHVTASPESMLSTNDPIRLFADQAAKEFGLHDMVLLAVTNSTNKNGVFNPKTLGKIYQLSRYAASLTDPENPARKVISRDIIAPDTVKNIEQAGLGKIRLQRLMPAPPKTEEEALRIRDNLLDNPQLKGTLISADGKSLAMYLPISQKDFACKLQQQLATKITALGTGKDRFYITGLPLAEDTFAQKMLFWQRILVSLNLLVISLLLLGLFRDIKFIIAPLILIPCTIVSTMGLLIGTGHSLNMMSSMIPFVILAVATMYCIHVLSKLADGYSNKSTDKKETVVQIMHQLFKPMLFSMLISAAGFASLAFTRFQPLRTFGMFVAIGIMLSWLLCMLFIPSCFILLNQRSWTKIFSKISTKHIKQPGQHATKADLSIKENGQQSIDAEQHLSPTGNMSILNRLQLWITKTSTGSPWLVIGINLLILVPGIVGILMIQANENPMLWFHRSSELRIASRIFNQHFSGTYNVNLILSGTGEKQNINQAAEWLSNTLTKSLKNSPVIQEEALAEISQAVAENSTSKEMAKRLSLSWQTEIDKLAPEDDAGYEAWSRALDTLDRLRNQSQIFKRPELLNYLLSLQKDLKNNSAVGKSNSIANIVQKIHSQLFEGDPGHFSIPTTTNGVTQALVSYQTEKHPDALLHLVTPDYTRANLWLQLKSADNKDMEELINKVNLFLTENQPPANLKANWTGPAYINMVVQKKMSIEIQKSLVISFLVVFIACAILFRSLLWSMPIIILPATVTATIFGILGLVGKDVAMPMVVLSFLPLVITADFVFHVLSRSRTAMVRIDDRQGEGIEIINKPNLVIVLSTIVLSLGCIPLLFAPLIPYQSTGVFFIAVTLYSGLLTLWIVPALLTVLQKWLLKSLVSNPANNDRQVQKTNQS